MAAVNSKRFMRFFSLDYYYSVLRRDWPISSIFSNTVLKSLSILVVSVHRFMIDSCRISAAALTFYSSLSIIPVIALFLAIARGFGVVDLIENDIRNQQFANPQISEFLINLANNALNNSGGSVITGVGIALLIWAVIRVLDSAEFTMNRIWRLPQGRTFVKKLTAYMSILFIAPLFIILISSVNVFLTTNLSSLAQNSEWIGWANEAFNRILSLVPYLLVWILFVFIYMYMPSTTIRFRYALWPGIIAGTVFQLIQWLYIKFQIGVTSYNAIYGSLAALPLLIIWIQLSWSIVLWGAELSYVIKNRHFIFNNEHAPDISWTRNVSIAIRVLQYIAQEFQANREMPTLSDLSKRFRINVGRMRILLNILVEKHILVELKKDLESTFYPAVDFYKLSLADVIIALTDLDEARTEMWREQMVMALKDAFQEDTFMKPDK